MRAMSDNGTGGYYGITDSTRRIVVKELEDLRDEVLRSGKTADEVIQDRIDKIRKER